MGSIPQRNNAHNDALTGTPKYSDNNALAHAYHQTLRTRSAGIHSRIVIEKDRLLTEASLTNAPLSELVALNSATL